MLPALRSGATRLSSFHQWKNLGFTRTLTSTTTNETNSNIYELLNLEEVEKILTDVKADNVKIIDTKDRCDWVDFKVFATGRSAWHVRNIAQALVYQVKQKQRGVKRMLLPSIEGVKEGKWIVIDSGSIVVHALDEKARAYYKLEKLWKSAIPKDQQDEDLGNAFLKVRPKNNSKRPTPQTSGLQSRPR